MTRSFRTAATLSVATLASTALAQGTLGTLRATRYVTVAEGTKTTSVRSGQSIAAGSEIATGRRSYAATKAPNADIRLDEQSRIALSAPEAVQLKRGSLFANGTLRINTDAAAVLVKEGTVVVKLVSEGITRVSSLGGSVEVEQDEARAVLRTGETVTFERVATRRLRGTPEPIDSADLPEEAGGSLRGWWHRIDDEDGLMVFPGSASARRLRIDPVTEAVSDIAAIPPAPQAIAENAARRQTLLDLAAARVTPTLDEAIAADPQLNLATFRQRFAADYVEDRFNRLTSSDRDFLKGNGIATVDQLFTALSASGGGFGPGIPLLRTEYKIFDRNEDRSAYALGGAVVALALGGGAKWSAPRPSAMAYGFLSDPQAIGFRGELIGASGKTRYHLEGNSLNLTGGSQDPSTRDALSQLFVERELTDKTNFFAGRRRFYAGPVMQNQTRGQLLADRYTGVGIRQKSGKSSLELAFLHDANPDRRGAQSGALASLTTQSGGGLVGFHVLNAAKVLGGGTGFTVSASQPMGGLDGYGEVGRSVDGQSVATVGVYLSSLFQKSGIDAWIEAGTREGYANAVSVGLSKAQSSNLTWRAFGTLNQPKGRGQNGKWGIGATWSYN
jgi:hypothetical protein